MIHYINVNSKRLCGRNNNINTKPLILEYNTIEHLEFQFIADNNQIIEIKNLSGLALAVGLKQNKPSYDLLALSRNYRIENNVLTFDLNCYTVNWLREINKNNTEAFIEISQESLNEKRVMLRDYCFVYPRTLIDGLNPEEIQSNNYYTKTEVDELISSIVISGYATEEYVDEAVATKQDIIDADNKLSYALVSGAPTIPTKTSDLTNDSGFITDSALQGYATETYVNSSVSGKADKSEIPTKTSDLQNDSGFITDSALTDYQKKITSASKLDYALLSATPTIPTKTSDLQNDSGFITENALSGKQDKITAESKLAYSLISGTPTIPTKTSDLTNDSDYVDSQYVTDATSAFITEDALQGYATEQYVDSEVSGKADKSEIPLSTSQLENDSGFITNAALDGLASEQYVDAAVNGKADKTDLADYQEKITSDAKLAYDLLSGTPTIPSKTSDLQNDSNFVTSAYVQAEVSGKADKSEIPLSTSQLANDSGFITDADLNGYATEDYVQAEVSGKQDVITTDNWLSAGCVRTELDPWSGDPEYTVDAAINIVHQEALAAQAGLSGKADIADIPLSTSQLTNDSGFITDSALTGKQDTIDFDHPISASNVDFDFENWEGGDPNFRLDAALNMVYGFTKDNAAAITGKLDNPSGGTVGQVIKKTADGVEWADDAVINPTNTTFEKKNLGSDTAYKADFAGKQIQKYSINSAARDKIEIQLENAETIPSGTAPTIELQVPSFGAETIIFPSSVQLIDELPETIENVTGKLTYHDIVFRAEKDEKDAVKVYANYAYKFSEDEVDYLYIEAVDDGDIIKLTTQYGSPTIPTLYYSYDKVNWNSVLLDADINLLNAGDKVYFKGDNTIINTPENRVTFSSTGRVNMGGNLFTILSEDGIPSGIQYSCFNSFLRGMTTLVSVKNLIIPDIEYTGDSSMIATTNVYYAMFRECTSLIDMPIMKQKYVYQNMFYAMFRGCTALTKVVVPPADTLCANGYNSLFYGCTNLNDVTVSFTDWIGADSTSIITPSWLNGVASSGTFKCPSGLSITRDDSHVPTNWAVLNI